MSVFAFNSYENELIQKRRNPEIKPSGDKVEVTADEIKYLMDLRTLRIPYGKMTKTELEEQCKKFAIPCSGKLKDCLIDSLIKQSTVKTVEIKLDEDQQAALDSVLITDSVLAAEPAAAGQIVVHAGPGSGKTLLLAASAHKLQEAGKRVCVLVYNRHAKNIILKMLKMYGIVNKKLQWPLLNRVSVFGLDELANSILNREIGEPNDTEYIETVPCFDTEDNTVHAKFCKSAQLGFVAIKADLKKANFIDADLPLFDYVIVDEAQDIGEVYIPFITEIIVDSTAQIILGDVRQSLYSSSAWFKSFVPTHTLRYNHRSSPEIVQALNDFAAIHYPKEPPMIAARLPAAIDAPDIITEQMATLQIGEHAHVPSLQIRTVPNWVDIPIDTYKEIANEIMKTSVNPSVLIIVPSVTKLNMNKHIDEIAHQLHLINPGQLLVVDINREYQDNIHDLFAANIYRLKGMEADICIALGCDIELPNFHNRYYTAISRARKRCIIYKAVSIVQLRNVNLPINVIPRNDQNIDRFNALLATVYEIKGRMKYKTISPLPDEFISLDIETCERGKLTAEIGAIHFKRVSGGNSSHFKIVSVYKKLADGTAEINGLPVETKWFNFTALTGIKLVNMSKILNCQAQMNKEFIEYAGDVKTFMKYAGSDEKMLSADSHTVDGFELYKNWLRLNAIERPNYTKLKHVVQSIFGPRVAFIPHRALEDALFTALSMIAISD